MITREADYAVRVILFLSDMPGNKKISTMEIAEKMFIPYRFLRKISRRLVEEGFIGSSKGKSGGIYLLKDPEEISLYDVINLFDPRALRLNSCELDDSTCPRQKYCKVHQKLEVVQKKLDNQLKATFFAELKEKQQPSEKTDNCCSFEQ